MFQEGIVPYVQSTSYSCTPRYTLFFAQLHPWAEHSNGVLCRVDTHEEAAANFCVEFYETALRVKVFINAVRRNRQ